MPFFGAAVKTMRGAYQSHTLPQKIEALKAQCSQPVVDSYQGAQRYEVASQLLEIQLNHSLQSLHSYDRVGRRRAQREYIAKLKEEFLMAQKNLSRQNATKADVAALGIVLKQMALGYDEHLERFQMKYMAAMSDVAQEGERLREGVQEQLRVLNSEQQQLITQSKREFTQAVSRSKREHDREMSQARRDREVLQTRLQSEYEEAQRKVERLAGLVESRSRSIDTKWKGLERQCLNQLERGLAGTRRDVEGAMAQHAETIRGVSSSVSTIRSELVAEGERVAALTDSFNQMVDLSRERNEQFTVAMGVQEKAIRKLYGLVVFQMFAILSLLLAFGYTLMR